MRFFMKMLWETRIDPNKISNTPSVLVVPNVMPVAEATPEQIAIVIPRAIQ